MNFEEGGTSSQQRAHSGSRGEVRQAAGGGREWHWGCTGRVSRCTGSPSGCTGCRSGCTGSLSGCTGCGFLGVGGGGRPRWLARKGRRGSRRASCRRTCPERAHRRTSPPTRGPSPPRGRHEPHVPLSHEGRGAALPEQLVWPRTLGGQVDAGPWMPVLTLLRPPIASPSPRDTRRGRCTDSARWYPLRVRSAEALGCSRWRLARPWCTAPWSLP